MISSALNQLLEDLQIPLAAIANLETGKIQWIGDSESVDNTHLITSLFGDFEAVQMLNQSLEGQLSPQSWGQGQVSCILCKPNETLLIGLFVKNDFDAVRRYRWAKMANEAVLNSFA